MADKFSDRLAECIKVAGSTVAIARALKVSEGTVRYWRNGGSEPGVSKIRMMADFCGVSVEWLVTGRGAGPAGLPGKVHFQSVTPYAVHNVFPDDFTLDLVPVEEEVAHDLPDGSVHVMVSFQGRGYVIQQINHGAGHLIIHFVRGDTMEPLLRDGDAVLVDTNTPAGEGLYALRLNGPGSTIIRRLEKRPHGGMWAVCDNRSYTGFQFNPRRDALEVVGRVVWIGRSL